MTETSIRPRINADLRDAMRLGQAERRDALRLLLTALKQESDERVRVAIDHARGRAGVEARAGVQSSERAHDAAEVSQEEASDLSLDAMQAAAAQVATLSTADELAVVTRLIKRHRDSISQFQRAGRDDLVAHEQAQLEALEAYLPQQLSEAEISRRVETAIAESGASGKRDMGRVMAKLSDLRGQADMSSVSKIVQSRLGE